MKTLNTDNFAYTLKSQVVSVKGEQVLLTLEDIKKASVWYADNAQGCIDEAVSGKVFVNNIESYTASKLLDISNYRTGNFTPWLGFWQTAVYLKTGVSVPML
ncbi:hypothetical protein S140_217 [Shewanella sp. phage 1/40]|uniref:hypothetical protein n=1 Tax=Shewanella sp. phage 1/40 TaxID=1458860 RepID=UPI0004F91BE5|nr:hypothetical protein S140_217 [Shewanella sp. phage 1/40]AHK11624.1 hypothetical protein S140_217 [Shewanella sp. phage 1/40]